MKMICTFLLTLLTTGVAFAQPGGKGDGANASNHKESGQGTQSVHALQALVIVEGDHGRGSAFVVKMEGELFLVTNSHVVRGNSNVKFKNLRNELIATGPLQIADSVDVVRAQVANATQALELAAHLEQSVKIGDAVVVAGNSEGEGVVREMPGKVVGIGPQRVEVDAAFVAGNSGSPILLKSTGQVIGVATYMKIPASLRGGPELPTSLNEVRRFGYRLDTVAKWISPQPANRLFLEGAKLAEMDDVMKAISSILRADALAVSKLGADGWVSKEQRQKSVTFAALATAIEAFIRKHAAAKLNDEKKKNVVEFFDRIRALAMDEVRDLREQTFSGYYATQFKDHMARRNDFFEWFNGTAMPSFRETWLASEPDLGFVISRSSVSRPKNNPSTHKPSKPTPPPVVPVKPIAPVDSQPTSLTSQLSNTKWQLKGGKTFTLHPDGTSMSSWTPRKGNWKVTGANTVDLSVYNTRDHVKGTLNLDRTVITTTSGKSDEKPELATLVKQ